MPDNGRWVSRYMGRKRGTEGQRYTERDRKSEREIEVKEERTYMYTG